MHCIVQICSKKHKSVKLRGQCPLDIIKSNTLLIHDLSRGLQHGVGHRAGHGARHIVGYGVRDSISNGR